MKNVKFLIFIPLIFLLSGCYNYRELNELAIVSAIGISKTDDEYKLTTQVMNTKKTGQDNNSSGEQPKFVTYNSKGKTIQKALRNVVFESPRRLYLNHMQLLIIDEDLAKDGIHDILDWFARDSESRKQFYVLISKNSEDVLNTLTILDTLNSQKITNTLKTDNRFLGISELTTFEKILKVYMNKNQEIILPTIKVTGDPKNGKTDKNLKSSDPKSKLIIKPMAVFKNDKLIGYLNEKQSQSLNFIKNNINSTLIEAKCPNNKYIVSEIIKTKTELKPITKSKNPQLIINIKGKGNINEITCDYDLEKNKNIKKIENYINNSIKNSIKSSIKTINQKYNSDIYGFGNLFYKNNPQYYYKYWNKNSLKNLNIKINVDIKLIEKGNILKVIKNE